MIHCTFENGNKASLRHVTTGCIVVDQNNKVLLVKRAAHLARGNTYTIPGGFLDRDEDAKEGALRELFEESGLTGKNPMLFHVNTSPNRPKEDRQNVDVIFVVREIEGELKESNETSEVRWFSKDDLPADDSFAFDHRDTILKYFDYLEKPFELPLLN